LAGSNSTPSSTPIGSMVGLGSFGADMELITDEGDVEEVVEVYLLVQRSGWLKRNNS